MALGTVIDHEEMSKRSFVKAHQEYYKLTCQMNAMIRQIQQEHKLIIKNMIEAPHQLNNSGFKNKPINTEDREDQH